MRPFALILAVCCCACATGLTRGDHAFAQKQWDEAAREWNAEVGHDEEVALRLALLYAAPDTPFHDPARAVRILTMLHAQWPDTTSGILAGLWLKTTEALERNRTRVAHLQAELTRAQQRLARAKERAASDRESDALALEEAEASRRRLSTTLDALRTELLTLTELQAENDALREELEALKLIDLRQ